MKKVILLIASMTAFAVMSQAQFVIENFDGSSSGSFTYKGGNATAFNSTATLAGANGFVGYSKRAGYDYDNVQYTLTNLLPSTTVSALKSGTLKFSLRLASQATPNIGIKIKLESSTTTGGAYSAEYDATTSLGGSNQWETLTFTKSNTGTVADDKVDKMVIFFILLGSSTDEFFFDDLKIFDPTVTTTGTTTGTTTAFVSDNSVEDSKTNIYPNPSNGLTAIDYDTDNSSALKVTLNDMVGREMQTIENKSGAAKFNGYVDASSLEPGVYYVTFQQNGVSKRLKKLMVVR